MEEQWLWSDKSTWDFTNWGNGRGDGDDRSLLLRSSGEWYDTQTQQINYFLCNEFSEAMTITKNGLTRLELKESSFPFLLTLRSPDISQRTSNASAGRVVQYIGRKLSKAAISAFLKLSANLSICKIEI